VLFSEPKIPQSPRQSDASAADSRFSALQRAENSSILAVCRVLFKRISFSALQRAENSSIRDRQPHETQHRRFQCSSASRKFLNFYPGAAWPARRLFQCSSASRKFLNRRQRCRRRHRPRFSALQRAENSSI